MSWEPASPAWTPDAELADAAWLAELRVELRRVRAPERLRAGIAAMLAAEEQLRS